MALPSSGQLTLAQIRDEFGPGTTSNVNLRTLSAAAGLSQPDQFSDFYGLSAYTPPTFSGSRYSFTGAGTLSNKYRLTLTSWDHYGVEFEGDFYWGAFHNFCFLNIASTNTAVATLDPISASVVNERATGGSSGYYRFEGNNGFGLGSGFTFASSLTALAAGPNRVGSAYSGSIGSQTRIYMNYEQSENQQVTVNNFVFDIWFVPQ